jgi:hypothetical protein
MHMIQGIMAMGGLVRAGGQLRVPGKTTPKAPGVVEEGVTPARAERAEKARVKSPEEQAAHDAIDAQRKASELDVAKLGRTVASHPVELLGESHNLRIVERGNGEFALVLCSNCGFVRGEIDAVLAETSAKGPTKSLRVRLERLRAEVVDLEKRMGSSGPS